MLILNSQIIFNAGCIHSYYDFLYLCRMLQRTRQDDEIWEQWTDVGGKNLKESRRLFLKNQKEVFGFLKHLDKSSSFKKSATISVFGSNAWQLQKPRWHWFRRNTFKIYSHFIFSVCFEKRFVLFESMPGISSLDFPSHTICLWTIGKGMRIFFQSSAQHQQELLCMISISQAKAYEWNEWKLNWSSNHSCWLAEVSKNDFLLTGRSQQEWFQDRQQEWFEELLHSNCCVDESIPSPRVQFMRALNCIVPWKKFVFDSLDWKRKPKKFLL